MSAIAIAILVILIIAALLIIALVLLQEEGGEGSRWYFWWWWRSTNWFAKREIPLHILLQFWQQYLLSQHYRLDGYCGPPMLIM